MNIKLEYCVRCTYMCLLHCSFLCFFLVFGLFSCTAFYRLWWIKMTISTIHIIRRGLLLHTLWSIWVFISHGLESFFESPLCVNMFLCKHKWLSLSQYAFDTLCSVTRCVSFSFVFLNFLFSKLHFMRIKMYILRWWCGGDVETVRQWCHGCSSLNGRAVIILHYHASFTPALPTHSPPFRHLPTP